MARLLPRKDVVIMGLGWTGSILAHELTEAGLDVLAIERGPWRDTATDFNIGYMADELRFALRAGVGGAGVHWNGFSWRYMASDFTLKTTLTQRYGAKKFDGLTIQDWGLSWE